MTLKIDIGETYTSIRYEGRLDTITIPDIQEKMLEVIKEKAQVLIWDIKEVNYVSSIGLRLFLMIQKYLKSQQKEIIIVGIQPMIKDIFDLSGFTQLFTFTETKSEALFYI